MAKNAIGILFEVKGQGSIKAGSGLRIKNQLEDIVKAINKDAPPKIDLKINQVEFKKEVESAKKLLEDLKKTADGIKMPTGSGGKQGGKKGSGGSGGSDYKKRISDVKKYFSELKKLQRDASRDSNLSLDGNKWKTTQGEFSAQDIQVKKVNDYYEKFNDTLNELGVSFNTATNEYGKFKDKFDDNGNVIGQEFLPLDDADIAKIAKNKGVAENEVRDLYNTIRELGRQNIVDQGNIAEGALNAWTNNANKYSDWLKDHYDTISKDPASKKLANQLKDIIDSKDPKRLDDLKNKWGELSDRVRESGSDIETWGQKFYKSFAGHVRSALAAIITAKLGQYVRDIYTNVVSLDSAVVNLQIASGKTRNEVKGLIREYSKLGKELGATTKEVAEGADTWLRQGYSATESNTLIKNSTMLAKLGQMEMTESSKALTSAMKGYKVSVSDSIGIVDKFTAVDMQAAASAGDIATAMAETATSADIAGVSMDKLIGYIATVKEVTQDGAESVGTFYKTLFARMNNVKAGKFVDEETGEALNDVEKVLGELGIKLRENNGEFKNSATVLDEIAVSWNNYDNEAQHAIATAMAGTRQQEKFFVLMENYGSALKYAATAANSSGTAVEKYGDYLDGIESKLNVLKATFEEFSTKVLNSDWVIAGIEFLTAIVDILNSIASIGDGALIVITGLMLAFGTLNITFTTLKPKVVGFIADLAGVSLAAKGARLSLLDLGKAAGALMNPFSSGYAVLAIITAATVAAIRKIQGVRKEAYEAAEEDYNEKIDNAKAAKEEAQQIDELAKKYQELKASNSDTSETRQEIREIQGKINALVEDEKLKVDLLNGSLDENLKKIQAIKKAQSEEIAATANEAYLYAKNKADKAYHNDIDDAGWVKFLREDRDVIVDSWNKNVADTLNEIEGMEVSWDTNILDNTLTAIRIDAKGANEYIEILNKALAAMELKGQTDDEVYARLYELREQYKNDITDIKELAKTVAYESIDKIASSIPIDETHIKTTAELEALKQAIVRDTLAVQNVGEAINEGDLAKEDVIALVDSYIDTTYGSLADKISKAETYVSKSIYDILGEIEGAYDALSDALADINEQDIISADTLKTILDPDNGYPELEKYLVKTANGYTLASGALEEYIELQKEAYVAALAAAEEGTEAWNIAYQNLENFLLVLATKELERSTEATKVALEKKKEALEDTKKPLEDQKEALEDEIDALEKEKEALEKSKKPLEEKQEAYEEQLDRYEELIEVRKELLESYREELEYQKELEKKQRNVASLRTRLTVAKLDTSAAGQARVRELESELQEAEEDLNDFTLEHAIDVITTQLDSQLSQYESYIGAKVSEITAAIDGIDDAIEGVETEIDGVEESIDEIEGKLKDIDDAIDDVDDAISSAADGVKGTIGTVGGEIKALLDEYLKKQSEKDKEEEEKEKARKAVQDYVSTHNMTEGDKGRWVQDPNFKALYDTYVSLGGSINDIIGASPKMMVQSYGEKTNSSDSNTTISQELFDKKKVVDEKGATYMPYPHSNKDLWVKEGEGFSWEKVSNRYVSIKYTPDQPLYVKKYHTGGLVGNIATLKTSEEFAKLLQGEFVSTPTQMKNFMQKTLPQIASYNSSTGNEFNAPLINITCDNVTSETLPSLEKIVNNAVVEIKKQLDSGMSRAGFKPSAKKLLL